MNRRCAQVLISIVMIVVPSCTPQSQAPPLYEVTGQVTIDGRTLRDGTITFEPADGRGGVYGERIWLGQFVVQSTAGPKRVSITASRRSDQLGPDGKPMFDQYLPARYNTQTKLTAEVVSTAKNQFKFDLTTKPAEETSNAE